MQVGLSAARLLHAFHQALDVLYASLRRDHHRVLGLDYDVFVEPDRGHEPVGRIEQAIAAALHHHVAARDVACGIRSQGILQRSPGTDVAPAGSQRHDGGAARLFHHGIVDRIGAAGLEGRLVQAHKIEVTHGRIVRLAAGRKHHGIKPPQFVEVSLRRQQEHAAVPKVVAACDERLGSRGIRFLDELRHVVHGAASESLADVAVTRFRIGRDDAESHEAALTGRRNRRRDGLAKRRDVREHMVRRKHEQECVVLRATGRGRKCRDRDCGRRIPSDRLENDRARFDAHLP